MAKQRRRARVALVLQVEGVVPLVLQVESDGRAHGGSPLSSTLHRASQLSARSAEQKEAERRADYQEARARWEEETKHLPEKDKRPPPREPAKSWRVYERKHLWAWLHQATDEVLKELYQTVMDKDGQAELGGLLREYFRMRTFYPDNHLAARPCPWCRGLAEDLGGSGSARAPRKTSKGC